MSKETKAEAKDEEISLSLDEFCARASAKDGRVELLSGFYADERAAGHTQDKPSAFSRRLDAYARRPIG